MKILRISLQNLNSLRGEHTVDLEAEPLASAGIFAITGQTGAGKSTLLDAITLALYGRAARYGESPNPEDMMSRHTGECRAEVEFEVPRRGRFRAVWQLRRAKGQVDGKVQPAKRYVYDENEVVLAEQVRTVDQLISDLCGLDYNRFTRSVLLAQGEFAKFLRAKPDERAELLESLTRTGIYSELGLLVHEELTTRQNELKHAEDSLGQIELLSEEERKETEASVESITAELAEVKKKRDALAQNLATARQLRDFLESEKELGQQRAQLAERQTAAELDFNRLSQHRLAVPFLPQLAQWDQARKRSESQAKQAAEADKAKKDTKSSWVSGLDVAAELGDELVRKISKVLENVRGQASQWDKQRREVDLWLEKHRADESLSDALPDIKEQMTVLAQVRKQMAEVTPPKRWVNLVAAEEELLKLASERDEVGRQAELERLQGRKTELSQLQLRVENLAKLEKATQDAIGRQSEVQKQAGLVEVRLKLASEKCEMAEQLLKSHLEHRRTAEQMASLEDHRAQLKLGEACPLCGALEHPFATSTDDLPKLAEIEKQIEKADEGFTVAKKSQQAEQTAFSKAQVEMATIGGRLAELKIESDESTALIQTFAKALQLEKPDSPAVIEATENCVRAIEAERAALARLEEARVAVKFFKWQEDEGKSSQALEQALKPFGVPTPGSGKERKVWDALTERRKAFLGAETQLRSLTEELKKAQDAEKDAQVQLQALRKQLEPILRRQAENGKAPRSKTASFRWKTMDAAEESLAELDSAANSASAAAKQCQKEASAAWTECQEQGASLGKSLTSSPFTDPTALRAASLSEDERLKITNLEKELTEVEQTLKGRQDTVGEEIGKLREAGTPEGDAHAKLEAQFQETDQTVDDRTKLLTTLSVSLRQDSERRKTFDTKSASLESERGKLKVWSQLHGLIGDGKGKKFRLYAQGISLDLMIRRANEHLQRLTERYLLRRVEGEELELEIEDRFQAGVTRPMASLSGGESFLASLALALGLSDLAGRNVQIDSLFIDEGFGSLDSDTLEIAISALEGLRQSNKTVGVISHVEILKERISTQISVEKQPDGTSQLVLRR